MADSHPPRLGTNDRARAHDPDHKAALVAERDAAAAFIGSAIGLDVEPDVEDITPAEPRGRHEKEADA